MKRVLLFFSVSFAVPEKYPNIYQATPNTVMKLSWKDFTFLCLAWFYTKDFALQKKKKE